MLKNLSVQHVLKFQERLVFAAATHFTFITKVRYAML